MSRYWQDEGFARVEDAARALHSAIDDAVEILRDVQRERDAGLELPEIMTKLAERGGTRLRLDVHDAYRELQSAATDYRASVIRALVDDHHATFSEIAAITGVSRQMVSRLYHMTDSP